MNTDLVLPLRDIHLPTAISFWPPAIGWIAVSILFCTAILYFSVSGLHHLPRWRMKRETLQRLSQLQKAWKKDPTAAKSIVELSILLRQVAITVFPREKVAGLVGERWIDFLNRSSNIRLFTGELVELLISAPYQSLPSIKNDAIFQASKCWIKKMLSKKGKYDDFNNG